jgi:hypothetical protein
MTTMDETHSLRNRICATRLTARTDVVDYSAVHRWLLNVIAGLGIRVRWIAWAALVVFAEWSLGSGFLGVSGSGASTLTCGDLGSA